MLQLDVLMPTQASDIMNNNREELPSQFGDFDCVNETNLSQLLTSIDEEPTNPREAHSILITTQHVEQINIDDSTETNFDEVEENRSQSPNNNRSLLARSRKTYIATSQNSLDMSYQDNIESSFDREFKQQYMEQSNINDSMAATFDEASQSTSSNKKNRLQPLKETDLATSQNSFGMSYRNNIETTFDEEFEQLNEIDFELPFFDDEATSSSDKDVDATQLRRSLELKTNENYKFQSKTQLLPPKTDTRYLQNISSSCPNFTKGLNSTAKNSQKDKCKKNVMDCLELSCSESSSSQQNKESSMNISEIVESTDSTCIQGSQFESLADTSEGLANKASANTPSNEYTTDAAAIPSTVKQLFDLMKAHYSDFSFVYAISAQLCQDRVPMGCFVNVKMALLLSIASIGKNPDIAPIPIIIMGNDSYMANYLITSIADLADRFVGPVDDTKPPSTDGFCNRVWIEADPIQLAKGGVFYVGEWSCLKTQRSEKIFKDIETTRVVVERTTRIYPLETAIWAHWRAIKYNSKDQQMFNKFVKIFGIPVYMDNSNHEALVDYVLKQASTQIFESTIDHLSISSDDMRKYLAVISARTVDFTHEAIDLLQKYFVASRIERPDCLTKQAYTVLKQFSESFAKLSLRHEVLTIDVIGAIFLCEHFIQHLYGVGVDPPPALESVSFVGYVDAHIAKFHEWLKSYITKYNDKN